MCKLSQGKISITKIFCVADHHFGHSNILKFTDKNGELIRGKIFKGIDEHDNKIIQWHNDLVTPQDHVYFLGDVVIAKKHLASIRRLNGHKRLVLGNHDIYPIEMYLEAGFEKIYGVRVFPKHGFIFTHIPLHPDSLDGRGWTNIHGHTHNNRVLDRNGHIDNRYRCVSLEQTDYRPILLMK